MTKTLALPYKNCEKHAEIKSRLFFRTVTVKNGELGFYTGLGAQYSLEFFFKFMWFYVVIYLFFKI